MRSLRGFKFGDGVWKGSLLIGLGSHSGGVDFSVPFQLAWDIRLSESTGHAQFA